MIEKIRNIFAIPELRRKILFTLGILVIVRLGSQVPIPGINPDALRQTMESLNDTFFGLFNLFTGGAFGQAAIFGLGIMPYISVSIVIQILQTTLPFFQRLAMEGVERMKELLDARSPPPKQMRVGKGVGSQRFFSIGD